MTPQRTATATTAARRPARVAFVGAGPGDASLMTVAAVDLLGRADAVITDQLTNEAIVASMTTDEVEVVDASHGEHGQQLTHASRAKLVVKTAKAHRGGLVVRLMDGDPAVFNGMAEEALALAKAGIPFDVVPGVTSASVSACLTDSARLTVEASSTCLSACCSIFSSLSLSVARIVSVRVIGTKVIAPPSASSKRVRSPSSSSASHWAR